MAAITGRFAGRVPLLANMVEGGDTPITDAADLQSKGFSIAIFPGGIVRALAHAGAAYELLGAITGTSGASCPSAASTGFAILSKVGRCPK